MFPIRKSGFRIEFRPDSNHENNTIDPSAGLRPAGGPILRLYRQESGRTRPGSPISGQEALLRNIGYAEESNLHTPSNEGPKQAANNVQSIPGMSSGNPKQTVVHLRPSSLSPLWAEPRRRHEVLKVPTLSPPTLHNSNAITRGFNKPHGVALEVVYRAENRCKSSWASAGAFPKAPRGRVEPGIGPKSTISGPNPPRKI